MRRCFAKLRLVVIADVRHANGDFERRFADRAPLRDDKVWMR